MTKCCNHCDVSLDDTTWSVGNIRKNNYICRRCDTIKGRRNRLKRLALTIFRSAEKQYNQVKAGHVYILTNPAWPEWIKVGMAIDAQDRCSSYQTSSPFRDYTLEYAVSSEDRRTDEAKAHTKLALIAEDRRGEWFKVSVPQAKECMMTITQ